MKLERPLDTTEIRIIGCLLEKQQLTPDVYPLTLNALRTAANQSTNRDPVTDLDDSAIEAALGRLQEIGLVWKVIGGRAIRWDHNLDQRWSLTSHSKAIVTLLLLRGAQTPGELRGRSERSHRFESVAEVESTLLAMAEDDDPLVRELARRPGQKEPRWTHIIGDPALRNDLEPGIPSPARESLTLRVERLETEVESLRIELRRLKQQLGEGD